MRRAIVAWLACISVMALVSCDDGDGDGDGDADTDVDADVDADADSSADVSQGLDGDSGGTGSDGGCGARGESCCTEGDQCGTGLVCCSGVPYPEGGSCEEECTMRCDRRAKEDLDDVDGEDVLARLTALPVTTWRYVDDQTDARHMGPMAQDFHAAFGLGSANDRIEVVDAVGVTMAAVQQLSRELEALRRENARLREELRLIRATSPTSITP